MSADGTWNLKIDTPMGMQKMQLSVAADGTTLTGTAVTMGGIVPLEDGTFENDTFAFTLNVSAPFPTTIAMSLAVDGDELAGTSTMGDFPPTPVTGTHEA